MSYGGVTPTTSAIWCTARFSRAAPSICTRRPSSSAAPTWLRANGSWRGEEGVLRSASRVGDARFERIEHDRRRGCRQDATGRRFARWTRRRSSPPDPAQSACAPQGLLAKAGAKVTVTSRRAADGSLAETIRQRFGGSIREVTMADSSGAAQALEGAEMFLNAGPAGVCLIPRGAWVGRPGAPGRGRRQRGSAARRRRDRSHRRWRDEGRRDDVRCARNRRI